MTLWEPDDIDRRIIERLRRENATNSMVARELGVSEGTVRQRLKRMTDAGVIRVAAGIDPDALANQQVVLIAVNCDRVSQLEEKARELSRLGKVLSVSIVSGRYDILVEVLVDSNRGLVDFLTGELSKVEGLTASESFMLLRNYGKYV